MKRHLLIIVLCTFFNYPFIVHAQYSVDTTLSTNQYVEKLLGPGVSFSNFILEGDRQAIGFFENANSQLGINKGIILSTGKASSSNGNSSLFAGEFNEQGLANIPELAAYVPNCFEPGATNDGIILQFDFIPQFDSIALNFVFASEEYDEYVCAYFNDAFAFLISGPGIVGFENLAVVPGSGDPITINTINNGYVGLSGDSANDPCVLTNALYYNLNPPTDIVYDGYTTVLTVKKDVIPCQTYTLRIMIADGCDSGFDSAVFIEGENFGTVGAKISSNLPEDEPLVYEACTNFNLTFSKPRLVTEEYVFHYTLAGTAINGIDYSYLPDSVFIPADVDSVEINVEIYQDNEAETAETLTFNYSNTCNIYTTEFQIVEKPALVFETIPVSEICTGQGSINLHVEVTQGILPFTYAWLNNGSTEPDLTVDPLDSTLYRVYVTDLCGTTDSVDFVVNVNPLPDSIELSFDTLTSSISFDEPAGIVMSYWLLDESNYQVVSEPNLTLTAAGTYSVYCELSDGCTVYSNSIYFDPLILEIEELDKFPFKLYPNPADDYFSISVIEDCNLEIYDLAGKLLSKLPIKAETQTISTTNFSSGMYLLKLRSNKGEKSIKLNIEKY